MTVYLTQNCYSFFLSMILSTFSFEFTSSITRSSGGDCLNLKNQHDAPKNGLLHCFLSSAELFKL
jgi:hypothetical protein